MNKLCLLTILFLSAFIQMPAFAAVEDAYSQQANVIKGQVIDESGVPVIGAGIMVKGTSKGTISDIDGFYSIDAAQGQVLVFSSIGYVEQEVTVGISNEINVTLKSDTELMMKSLLSVTVCRRR